MATIIERKEGGGPSALWFILGALLVIVVLGVLFFAAGDNAVTSGPTRSINSTTERVTDITRDATGAVGDAARSTTTTTTGSSSTTPQQ